MKGKILDPLGEIKRQMEYKEAARKGMDILKRIKEEERTHKYFYLLGQGYFNLWDNENAFKMIEKAIDLVKNDPNISPSYFRFKRVIQNKLWLYTRNRKNEYSDNRFNKWDDI